MDGMCYFEILKITSVLVGKKKNRPKTINIFTHVCEHFKPESEFHKMVESSILF